MGDNMKIVEVIKVVICLILLIGKKNVLAEGEQYHYNSGRMESGDQHQVRGRTVHRKEAAAGWWLTEDYSHPQRRRHVHNDVQP
ncbi:hypothetical protein RHSIM_Rhsim08G0047500 [Rhododendron simsii]|uniref:Uncharacterized protein n=1 Tax=Rhododendron simsii TaxID=118357 RepID=A0A834LHL5_RHOSS|nr:hypothetical protein RHSIM_Rhsim08G0047500 [Rhododendron simsii]